MNEMIVVCEDISCSICLEDFSEEDTYKTECNHSFCKECLVNWFRLGNKTCPLCRQQIDEYKDIDTHYKLIIYEKQSNIPSATTTDANRLLHVQNVKLRIYTFTSIFLFGTYLYHSFVYLNDYDIIKQKYQICMNNNTELITLLKPILTTQNEPVTYISLY